MRCWRCGWCRRPCGSGGVHAHRWPRPRRAAPALTGSRVARPCLRVATATVQVSAGGAHTCAIKIDRTTRCWGSNSHGQATAPPGTFKAIDAGRPAHVRHPDRRTRCACWGKNDDGEATAPPGTFRSSAPEAITAAVYARTTPSPAGDGTPSHPRINVAPPGSFTSVSAGTPQAPPGAAPSEHRQPSPAGATTPTVAETHRPAGSETVEAGGTHGCGLSTRRRPAPAGAADASNGAPTAAAGGRDRSPPSAPATTSRAASGAT